MKSKLLLLVLLFTTLLINAQDALVGESTEYLDINNVKAMMLNAGDMFWDQGGDGNARYEIPKGSGKHSVFAAALWVGGVDDNTGDILVTAQTYRQNSHLSYWPGPVEKNVVNVPAVDAQTALLWDKHFKVNKSTIEAFKDAYADGNVKSTFVIHGNILYWPGRNNPYITDGRNMDMDLAPFEDVNGDGVYDPMDGDYPKIMGHQSVWWVMNDVGYNKNLGNGTLSIQQFGIGLEIQVEAFAFKSCNQYLDDATFYKYTLINKGPKKLNETHVSMWIDYDLGNFVDDFVACDVNRGMMYGYNGDNDDEGIRGYGTEPASVGFDFVKGIQADDNDGIDNDRDGFIDEVGEEIIMSNFHFYDGQIDICCGNPSSRMHYFTYGRSLWKDSSFHTYGEDGRNLSNPPCKFFYPGNSDSTIGWGLGGTPSLPIISNVWSEISEGNTPADRRGLMSMGPFTFDKGESKTFVMAIPWARGQSADQAKINMLLADDQIQYAWDNGFPDCPVLGLKAIEEQVNFEVYPNPVHNQLNVLGKRPFKTVRIDLMNAIGQSVLTHQASGRNFEIDVSHLPKGIYQLIFKAEGHSTVKKIIID